MKKSIFVLTGFVFSLAINAQESPVKKDTVILHERGNNDTISKTYSNPARLPNSTANDNSGKMSNGPLNRSNSTKKRNSVKGAARKDSIT